VLVAKPVPAVCQPALPLQAAAYSIKRALKDRRHSPCHQYQALQPRVPACLLELALLSPCFTDLLVGSADVRALSMQQGLF